MLRIVTFIMALMVAMPGTARAEDVETESKLRAVTVYSNRAMLTRQAIIEIPAGAHTVIFKNLPASLLPDSLRAEGKAAASVKFGALTNRMVMSADLIAPKEKELNDQLELLQDQRRAIESDKQALSIKQNFLTTLSQQGALRTQEDIAEINLKPDQWDAAAKAIYIGIADTMKAQLEQDILLRGIDKQVMKIQNEINQLHTGQRSAYEVRLPLESAAATTLTVDISYQLPDASWTPLYDARLNTKAQKLELVQYGAVRQNTGEDWNGVALTLSTAQPQRGAGLPELGTMWVGLYQAVLNKARFNVDGGAVSGTIGSNIAPPMEMAQDAMPAAAPVPQKVAQFSAAIIETGGFVSEYKIPGPSTVTADGTESKLMIGTFDTTNEIRIQARPQISSEAYLVGHMTLKGEAPILPGPVSLFRDGAYVGQSALPLLRPGQINDLSFGVDDQVSVRRRVMKDENSEAGVLSRDSVLERNYLTEIENLHSKPVTIVVFEAIPVAQDKQITVQLLPDLTTQGYIENPDNVKGILRWAVPVEPKKKTEVKLGWRISWPKGQSLSGL